MTIRILCIVIAFIVAVWVSYKIELSRGWTAFFTLLVSAAVGFLATITPLNYNGYVTTVKSYETRVVSRYLAERTKPPVMLATIVPVVTPVRTGYRPDCYVSVYNGESDSLVFSVSDTDYGTLLEGKEVTVTYYYINDTLYNVKLNDYDCANRINLRDSNIFTQYKLLEEALNSKHIRRNSKTNKKIIAVAVGSLCGIALYYHLKKSETNETYTVLSATVKDKYIKDTEYWESCILIIGDYEFVVPEGIYSKTHIGDTTTLKYFYDNGRLLRVQFGDIDGRKADGDIKIHHDAGLQ